MMKIKIEKFTKKIALALLLMLPLSAMSEYRAYQYLVVSKPEEQTQLTKSKSVVINSSLNPISYMTYHGGEKIVRIQLLNSWYCPGNTSKKEICPAPKLRK